MANLVSSRGLPLQRQHHRRRGAHQLIEAHDSEPEPVLRIHSCTPLRPLRGTPRRRRPENSSLAKRCECAARMRPFKARTPPAARARRCDHNGRTSPWAPAERHRPPAARQPLPVDKSIASWASWRKHSAAGWCYPAARPPTASRATRCAAGARSAWAARHPAPFDARAYCRPRRSGGQPDEASGKDFHEDKG
jgi:hypothetical protein